MKELFREFCRMLDIDVYYQEGDIYTVLMSGPRAYAVLELAREEGFHVEITTGVLKYNSYAVALIEG
jgi:hypothetical protein